MKKITWLLILALTFTLTACGGGGASSGDASGAAPEAGAPSAVPSAPETGGSPATSQMITEGDDPTPLVIDGKQMHIVYLANEVQTPWSVSNVGFIENLVKRCGGRFTVYNAEAKAEVQAQQAQDLLTLDADFVMVKPVDSAAIVASLKELNKAGIPLLAIDNYPDEGADLVTVITSNQYSLGQVDAQWISDRYKVLGKDAVTVCMTGPMESQIALQRQRGFDETAAAAGNVQVREDLKLDCQWDSNIAYSSLLDALQRSPEINSVFVMGDGMLSGVISALKQADRFFPFGEEGHVAVLGVDATSDALGFIRDGSIDGSAEHNSALHADVAVRVVIDYLHGFEIPKEILFRSKVIDAANVDDPNNWGAMDLSKVDSWEPLKQDFYELQYATSAM